MYIRTSDADLGASGTLHIKKSDRGSSSVNQYSDNLREIDLTGIEKIVYFGRSIDLMLRHNDVSSHT